MPHCPPRLPRQVLGGERPAAYEQDPGHEKWRWGHFHNDPLQPDDGPAGPLRLQDGPDLGGPQLPIRDWKRQGQGAAGPGVQQQGLQRPKLGAGEGRAPSPGESHSVSARLEEDEHTHINISININNNNNINTREMAHGSWLQT